MGLLDALFGRTRLAKSKPEGLFALVTAQVSLESELGWVSAQRAGLCVKPVTSGEYAAAEEELRELVAAAAADFGSDLRVETDSFHFRWLVLHDRELEDLVNLIHIAGQTLAEKGYGDQLLSALFRFHRTRQEDSPGYWVYHYKRGRFYPFVPRPGPVAKARDNGAELRAAAVMRREMPIEPDQSRWFAVWDSPV
ncbi:MAG TPA: hypothetical protein VF234_01710 [Limnochordia bacterium]